MLTQAIQQMKAAAILLLIFTFLTGIVYPGLVTLIAQLAFPWQANGSLIKQQNKTVGSALIGQQFELPQYFSSRPSATTPFPYNMMSSNASNLGPLNAELLNTLKLRIETLRKTNPDTMVSIPMEMITASASGLDPDISMAMAYYQIPRIAKVRKADPQKIQNLVRKLIRVNKFGVFGSDRINVLELNLALDQL